MRSKVKLFFKTFVHLPLKERIPNHKIIRLMGLVQLETATGWSESYDAIIDTGAHTSLIPHAIWKETKFEQIGKYEIKGLSLKPECAIPVVIGKLKCVIADNMNVGTEENVILAFLALTDEVPLIIGFRDLREKFTVHFNYETGEAYIEEK